jgi:hypothetical protein
MGTVVFWVTGSPIWEAKGHGAAAFWEAERGGRGHDTDTRSARHDGDLASWTNDRMRTTTTQPWRMREA